MSEQDDINKMKFLINSYENETVYWAERARNADQGYSYGGQKGVSATVARHHQQRALESKLELIKQLKELGHTYDGPPTSKFIVDVVPEKIHGMTRFSTSPASTNRCIHEVEAVDFGKAAHIAVTEHVDKCVKKEKK